MDKEKHAYLVIAHKYDEMFFTLLKMLDHPLNDIFLHMDIKCREFDEENVRSTLKKSNLYLTKRTDVNWGNFRQINAELLLLDLATKTGKYRYYHLISGQDLPIKSQDYIHDYLKDSDLEYLEVVKDEPRDEYRVRYFHFISKKRNVTENHKRSQSLMDLQKKLGIERNKKMEVRKGSNWFSITDDLARYIVKNEGWIRRHFFLSVCADELFIQTLVNKSPFKARLYKDDKIDTYSGNKREIDWTRCNGMNPHVYTMEDLEMLTSSDNLFARKFDPKTDMGIIEAIYELYKRREDDT